VKHDNDDDDNDGVTSCPYAKHFNLHHETKQGGEGEAAVPDCPAFKEGCPFADISKYSSEQVSELLKKCPAFKEGCPFKKNAETGESSIDYENCPAFKDGCPFANMSEWTEEQKAQIENCPLFKKGCPFKGKCPFDSKDHKDKDKKKEKKEKIKDKHGAYLMANYVTAISSIIEDDTLYINMLSDNVKGVILMGSQPPRVIQGIEQAVAWLKSVNSEVVSQNIEWLDLQFVKESSRIYATRRITVHLKSGRIVEFYISTWSAFAQGKITEFEIVNTIDKHSDLEEGDKHLSSETEILI